MSRDGKKESRDKKKKRQVKVTRSLENSPNSPRPKLNLRQTSSVVLSVDSAENSCHGYESSCHGYESSPQLRPKNLLLRASHVTSSNHVTLSTSPTSPHLSPVVKPGRSSTVSGNLSSPPPIRIVKSRSAEFVRHHAISGHSLPSNALPSHVVSGGHVGTEPSSPTVTQRSKNSTPDSFVTWLEAAKHAVSYVGFFDANILEKLRCYISGHGLIFKTQKSLNHNQLSFPYLHNNPTSENPTLHYPQLPHCISSTL